MRTSELYAVRRGMLGKLLAQYVDSSGHRLSKPSAMKPLTMRPRVFGEWSPPAFYTPIADIGVSNYPALIALNPDNRYAWVTHGFPMFGPGNTVDQIDISTNTVLGSITVGNEPTGVAVTSDNTTVCVISPSAKISVIDISSSTDFGPFPTTPITYPVDIAASPTKTMWITSNIEGEPIIEFDISGAASTVKTTIAPPVTTTLGGVAAGPVVGGNYSVWVCDTSFNQIYQIDASAATIIHTIPLSYRPLYIAVSPDNSFVWVTHLNDFAVSRINVATRAVTTILVPPGCIYIKVSSDSAYVWATNFLGEGGGFMIQIDAAAATVVNYITDNSFMISPVGIAIDPSNTSFWIPAIYNSMVQRFPIKTIPVFTVNGSTLLNYGEVTVSVSVVEGQSIDLSTLISVGGGAILSYSINDGTGSLVGSLLTVPASGSVQIEVRSSQVEDPQSSGAILVTLTITVISSSPVLCNGGFVLPNYKAQLSGSERISIRSAVTIYNGKNTDGNRRFKNGADYIAYKKASMLANATQTFRPPPTSALLNTVPPAGCGDGTVLPAAPTSLVATAGDGSASIAFTPGSDGGAAITNYRYSTDGGVTFTEFSPPQTSSPVTITGLANGTTYSIQLEAVNANGPGPASGAVSVTPVGVPAAPTSLVATPGDESASIAFTEESDGGSTITNYEYSTDGGSTFMLFAPPQTASPVTITGLTNGTAYSVVLKAVNANGSSVASAAVSVTPAIPVSGSPRILILGDSQAASMISALQSAQTDMGYTGTMTFTTKDVYGADNSYTGSDINNTNYDVVILYTNGGSTPSATLGANLDTYVTNGGRFIMGVYAWGNVTAFPGLTYANSSTYGYVGTQSSIGSTIGTVVVHPILSGINGTIALSGGYTAAVSLTSGSTTIANYSSDSTSFIAVREPGSAKLVGINYYLGLTWSGSMNQNVLRYLLNAIYWSIGSLV